MKIKYLIICLGLITSINFLLSSCTRSASQAPQKPVPSLTPAVIKAVVQEQTGEDPTISPSPTALILPTTTITPEPPTPEPLGTQFPNDPLYKGQHVVQSGEALYMLGRAYQVEPMAIAEANNIPAPFLIFPGDIINIPRIVWNNIETGPVAIPQFQP